MARAESGPGSGLSRELHAKEVAGVRAGVRAEGVATASAETIELEMVLCKPPEAAVIFLQSVFRGALVRDKYIKLKVCGQAGGGGE